jgi:hypothetical protein
MGEAKKVQAKQPNASLRSALTTVFQEMDTDKSYTLSRWEMGDFIHITLRMAISEQQVDEIVNYYDHDGGMSISYKELIDSLLTSPPASAYSGASTSRSSILGGSTASRRDMLRESLSMGDVSSHGSKSKLRSDLLNATKQESKHEHSAEFINSLSKLNKKMVRRACPCPAGVYSA